MHGAQYRSAFRSVKINVKNGAPLMGQFHGQQNDQTQHHHPVDRDLAQSLNNEIRITHVHAPNNKTWAVSATQGSEGEPTKDSPSTK